MAEHFITGITKEGSVILISLNDRPNPIKYNCNTGELTSFTGRAVKHFPQSCSIGNMNEGQRWAINVIIERIETGSTYEFERMEKYIAVLDLIHNPWRVPNECPQGYIKWVRDNDKDISIESLAEFQNVQKINKLTKEDKDVYEKLRTAFCDSDRIIIWWLNEENSTLRQKFRQIFKATIKSFTWNMYKDLCDWQRFFIVAKNGFYVWGDNWIEYLDGNRDFRYNLKTCEEQKNKVRNEKILANEEKIRSITEIQHDNFIIIVPSTMDDFTKEGQMQNNCVGSYYHDSIASGDNLIYFIRKKENPNHSYITNRFNISCQRTVETRKINNRDNDDKKALMLIEEIDKKIKELLASKK
jgi:hypothetical protein